MIPSSLRDVLSAARGVGVAHVAMKRAKADEVSERVAKKKATELYTACEKLVAALQAAEADMQSMRVARGFDWTGVGKVLTGFAGIVREARAGKLTGAKAREWVDGQVSDFETDTR